jgi:hypothetical protein
LKYIIGSNLPPDVGVVVAVVVVTTLTLEQMEIPLNESDTTFGATDVDENQIW